MEEEKMTNKKSGKETPVFVETNISKIDSKTKTEMSKFVGAWLAIQNKEMPMRK